MSKNNEDTDQKEDNDDDMLMDHCCLEMMHAIDSKDKEKFMDALQVVMAHTIKQMMGEDEDV